MQWAQNFSKALRPDASWRFSCISSSGRVQFFNLSIFSRVKCLCSAERTLCTGRSAEQYQAVLLQFCSEQCNGDSGALLQAVCSALSIFWSLCALSSEQCNGYSAFEWLLFVVHSVYWETWLWAVQLQVCSTVHLHWIAMISVSNHPSFHWSMRVAE